MVVQLLPFFRKLFQFWKIMHHQFAVVPLHANSIIHPNLSI